MALTPLCDRCKKELTAFGAILFSPPDDKSLTRKWHLCTACYDVIAKEIEAYPTRT